MTRSTWKLEMCRVLKWMERKESTESNWGVIYEWLKWLIRLIQVTNRMWIMWIWSWAQNNIHHWHIRNNILMSDMRVKQDKKKQFLWFTWFTNTLIEWALSTYLNTLDSVHWYSEVNDVTDLSDPDNLRVLNSAIHIKSEFPPQKPRSQTVKPLNPDAVHQLSPL